jgi:lipopolysaccharide export system protein LptC
MDDLSSQFPQSAVDTRDNLTRLLNLGRRKRVRVNRRYSFFVRGMQILLPVLALGIVVIVMAWPKMDETITAIPREEIIPQKTGQNELINPRFESADNKGNPYIITAARAVQEMGESAAVLMDKPVADIDLGHGEKMSGNASNGTYKQKENLLNLEGDITLTHSNGYVLTTTQLDIGIKNSTAESLRPVTITGPAGTLTAQGMNADHISGTIIFTGPARLVLKKAMKGL